MKFDSFPWTALNHGVGHILVAQYISGRTDQQIKHSKQSHKEIKDDFYIIVEVDNQVKNHIGLVVD